MSQKAWQIRDRRVGGLVGGPEDKVSIESFPFAVCMGKLVTMLVMVGEGGVPTADDSEEIARHVAAGMNAATDDIARAVKASLVEHCRERVPWHSGQEMKYATLCTRNGTPCEPSAKEAAVDPLECPLVRRVLDALGMRVQIFKSGEQHNGNTTDLRDAGGESGESPDKTSAA